MASNFKPFTMQTTRTDQLHCTQLCSLYTKTVVQSSSHAPTSESMPNYAPNVQPPNYANNYAGIIPPCLVGGATCVCVEGYILGRNLSGGVEHVRVLWGILVFYEVCKKGELYFAAREHCRPFEPMEKR